MFIRPEEPADYQAIDAVTHAAFATVSYGSEHDGKITGLLRKAGALTLSLVALERGEIIGHVAFSPVKIAALDLGWFCLGPVSVRPDHHGQGVGGALIRNGLHRLKAQGAKGCVLLGNPKYYGRFDFAITSDLHLAGETSPYLQAIRFSGDMPQGDVMFHPAFEP